MSGHPAAAAAAGPTPDTTAQVYVTRDCMHFRPLARTPLAPIASRFFALLRGNSEASQSARRAFAHCVVDHELPLPTVSNYSKTLDDQIRELFVNQAPLIVCVQGPLKVDFLHNNNQIPNPGQPRTIINSSNNSSGGSNPSNTSKEPICLHNTVFVGYTLHNELTRCAKEDPEQYGRYAFFFLCALVHETSHWILTKIHGFRTDNLRKEEAVKNQSINGKTSSSLPLFNNISISQAGQTKPDYLIAIGQRYDDSGARSTDMLIGATSKIITFADGDTDIVRRGFSPRIVEEPAILFQSDLLDILGLKSMPKMQDVTGEAAILIGGPIPKWSTHDNYLVTSQCLVNSYCAHGITRIGKLFN